MKLKTDYLNDVYAGPRKYELVQNDDGTISLYDKTDYIKTGDIFSAEDINQTNMAVNNIDIDNSELKNEIKNVSDVLQVSIKSNTIAIPFSGWSNTYPYYQEITVSGMKSTYTPIIGLYLTDTSSAASVKSQQNAFGYLDEVISENERLIFYCYREKPNSNFTVSIKGI